MSDHQENMFVKCIPPYTPLLPVYIEKLEFAGAYLFFLFLIQNIDCGYSLEPVPTINNLSKNMKISKFFQ